MLHLRIQPQLRSSSISLGLLYKSQLSSPSTRITSNPSTRTYRASVLATSLPRVAQPSFWQLIIPKFLRKSQSPPSPEKLRRSKEWNPATYFIVMSLLIGSNAINMITLKNELRNFNRKIDVSIELLQDVIERLGKGEDVDVQKALGTGDEEKEREWENLLQEIEKEEPGPFQSNARRRDRRRDQQQSAEKMEMDADGSSKELKADGIGSLVDSKKAEGRTAGNPRPGFY